MEKQRVNRMGIFLWKYCWSIQDLIIKYRWPMNNKGFNKTGSLISQCFSINTCDCFRSINGEAQGGRWVDCMYWSMPFYIGDLSIADFGICEGSWNQSQWILRAVKFLRSQCYMWFSIAQGSAPLYMCFWETFSLITINCYSVFNTESL